MGKWSTRLALGFSTSVPGCLVEKRNVLSENDVVSSQGSDMTDGAGFMNKAAARALRDAAGCHDMPSAVQMRIDGAKVSLSHRASQRPFDISPRVFSSYTLKTTQKNPASGSGPRKRKYSTLKTNPRAAPLSSSTSSAPPKPSPSAASPSKPSSSWPRTASTATS